MSDLEKAEKEKKYIELQGYTECGYPYIIRREEKVNLEKLCTVLKKIETKKRRAKFDEYYQKLQDSRYNKSKSITYGLDRMVD